MWLAYRRGIIIVIISAFLLGLKANLLCMVGERGIFIAIIAHFYLSKSVKANLFRSNILFAYMSLITITTS